jgi:alpha-L-arabinofuranosidase
MKFRRTLPARFELSEGLQTIWLPVLLVFWFSPFVSVVSAASASPPATLTVSADQPGHTISPTLYGIFFEDINCSADGGLYAELVRNRNFEDSDQPEHWQALEEGGSDTVLSIDSSHPVSPKNPHSLDVTVKSIGQKRAGVANSGFWGMGLRQGESYNVSFFARGQDAMPEGLTVALESKAGEPYAQAKTGAIGTDWKLWQFKLKPSKSDPQARLTIATSRPGTFSLDMVSVFPEKTWKNRPNGLRRDLAQMLKGLDPSFVRFPGGCWVEGDTMDLAYRWKQTVGDPSERRTQYNIWQYHATHGIGYHEYLQLCEDLRAEPLFVINCGMSHKEVIPLDKMPEFVQDALDAIEYANGPVTSKWGALRARNHHPAPFHLKYMEIGNENGGPPYQERYALFYDAIKAKFPEMHLIANEWGGRPANRPVEIVDEHYYSTPEFFLHNATKYDSYDRAGRKVYVGEYAVTQGCGQGNLRAAVGEAAFMTGLERNSDVVLMASYAPLFANVNYKKWNPDLIDFDSSRVYGLPSYYAQKMFSENRGEVVLPLEVASPETISAPRSGAVGVGTWRTEAEFRDLQVTHDGETLFKSDFVAGTNGWRFRGGGEWSVQDGALHQQALGENVRAFAGDKRWSNYTYSLKARKLGGREGFLIPFLVQNEQAKCWWNIGGWDNSRHAIEMDGVFANEVSGHIETGRWYDIRIQVGTAGIKCYLDGSLIHDVPYPRTRALYAVASRTKGGREIILKVVNASPERLSTQLKITGVTPGHTGKAIVLSSGNPDDENSIDEPDRVVPKSSEFRIPAAEFSYDFPGNSVAVLRVPVR